MATPRTVKKRVSQKTDSKKVSFEQSGVYIIASSFLIAALAVSATVIFFGLRIMGTLDEIQYPYDPSEPLSIGSLLHYARQEGINSSWFKKCVQSTMFDDAIETDLEDATSAKIDGTPGFYIGEYVDNETMRGFILPGNYPYSTFSSAIELVDNKGVDEAFSELTSEIRGNIYDGRYDMYMSYYSQQFDEKEAEQKASASAQEYADEKWQIREVGLGKIAPLKEGNPKVVIVEFTDFECPVCKSFANNTFPEIEKDYIEKGTVAFYIRNLPIESLHDNAMNAARAAFCANEKGKFWDYEPNLR